MPIQIDRLRGPLQAFDFKTLFIRGLGWLNAKLNVPPIEADGKRYVFTPVAEQGGLLIAECTVSAEDPQGHLPPVTTRRKLSKQFSGFHHEHILIFTDRDRQASVWLWPKYSDGKLKIREQSYRRGQPGDLLLGKLAGIAFSLDDLDDTGRSSISEVNARVSRAFDVERITRRFYDNFKIEHDHFQDFLTGIRDTAHQAWYTSVMLNRLMFLYFVQKKGFLNADTAYLRTKLAESQRVGEDRFYREFLLILFFEGLACEPRERSAATNTLLGSVPYLNGGIFMPHQIEEANLGIAVPDAAFERLFDFFDRYTWYLDDRPLHADNEINPDVLGFIFEKYINQKQMGAYYTKEDITDYICKYTILPFLLDKIGLNVAQELTSIDPFIYEAVKTEEYLPTETEREYAARQRRYEQIGLDFAAGRIATVNDLITWNLDIRAFASDWLRRLDAPTMLRRFYTALTDLTVLDPTCGSGAFLFAAMNILEPLYEGCLRKMEAFVAREDGHAFTDFQAELARVRAHPNERYFIFKSIIVNNLYGVDIMDEAVEICKLRLFLRLVAQVTDVRRIEPLPDIDFNIRAGNTLVGFATEAEIEADLFAANTLPRIRTMSGSLRDFRQQQLQHGVAPATLKTLKASVRRVQVEIAETLDNALMSQYGQRDLPTFRASHKPFHWYAEYNGVMANGGFDVIVGNPPYVEYSKVRREYTIRGYKTEDSGNLYSMCTERCFNLGANQSRVGIIVPLGGFSTNRMVEYQKIISNESSLSHISYFSGDAHPAVLFDGVKYRLCVILSKISKTKVRSLIFTTAYLRWYADERNELFSTRIIYEKSPYQEGFLRFAKLGSSEAINVVNRMLDMKIPLRVYLKKRSEGLMHYHRSPNFWIRVMDFEPYFKSATREKSLDHFRDIYFADEQEARAFGAFLSSTMFYIWFTMQGNCRNLTGDDLESFPVGALDNPLKEVLSRKFGELMEDYRRNAKRRIYNYAASGKVEYDEFYPRFSKPIIDEIDRVLAQHYGFTEEELDFIINYDIKYRMGKDVDSDEGEE